MTKHTPEPLLNALIKTAPTRRELADRIWDIVSHPDVDRPTAIEALDEVRETLRIDEGLDRRLGLTPQGRPS